MIEKVDAKDYKITITSRKNASIEGVENVESFDDEQIVMNTKMGLLVMKGQNLHIVQLDLEKGILFAEGFCRTLEFADEKSAKGMKTTGKSIWQRILR